MRPAATAPGSEELIGLRLAYGTDGITKTVSAQFSKVTDGWPPPNGPGMGPKGIVLRIFPTSLS